MRGSELTIDDLSNSLPRSQATFVGQQVVADARRCSRSELDRGVGVWCSDLETCCLAARVTIKNFVLSSTGLWVVTARARVPSHCAKASTHEAIRRELSGWHLCGASVLAPTFCDVCREIPLAAHSISRSDRTLTLYRTWKRHRLIWPHGDDSGIGSCHGCAKVGP
jgi:hypothetical protein